MKQVKKKILELNCKSRFVTIHCTTRGVNHSLATWCISTGYEPLLLFEFFNLSAACLRSYADMLTPYMNSVPAIIAKASAIHNPIVYAITHPKYRQAIGKYVPCLRSLFGVVRKGSRTLSGGSFQSTRHSTLSSQMSCSGDTVRWHRQPTCTSDSESVRSQDRDGRVVLGKGGGVHDGDACTALRPSRAVQAALAQSPMPVQNFLITFSYFHNVMSIVLKIRSEKSRKHTPIQIFTTYLLFVICNCK